MTRYATPAGSYHIDPLPGQPQIAHCHGFFVPVDRRGMGLAHMLKEHQVANLAAEHYDYATATVDASNEAQKRVLEKAGFRHLASLKNSKTGGTTELWGYAITKE
jgi:RimJ/RimL family protein N-acetyltransferase